MFAIVRQTMLVGLFLAGMSGCGSAEVNDSSYKWLVLGYVGCSMHIRDGVSEEEFCSNSSELVGVNDAGYRKGHDCPKNGVTPYRIEESRQGVDQLVIGQLTCKTEGSRTTIDLSAQRKNAKPDGSYTMFYKGGDFIVFEVTGDRCRLIEYKLTSREVTSFIDGSGKKNGMIHDYNRRMKEPLACKIFSTSAEAVAERRRW